MYALSTYRYHYKNNVIRTDFRKTTCQCGVIVFCYLVSHCTFITLDHSDISVDLYSITALQNLIRYYFFQGQLLHVCRITAAVLVSDYSDCAQLLKCRLIVYACCKLLLLQRLHSPGCGVGCVCPTLLDKQLGSYDIRTQHGSIYLSGSSNEQVYIWQSFYTGYC